ncbi:hypothetical protein LTR36_004333 [Oleoguttula mirabilis]|uniref:Ion transport domain-containing protein n=1 Tax=Oleoguttula mirabilis TaxID=1507867 RepID=A0AAV9JHV1_9PEZI|nr:hypothetical protein LTR36_004333 [Oleoguttula mirabilis]
MFSLLRGSRRGKTDDKNKDNVYSPFAVSPETSRNRVVGQTVDDDDVDDDEDLSPGRRPDGAAYFDQVHAEDYVEEGDEDEDEDEDEDALGTPLLPIFSAAHLDRLPLYNITHAIRLMVIQKCETTLSWDQLRSPQISNFVVKPIQTQIRTNHFNRATLCALIANSLQFQKEAQLRPGNVGVSKTRALISELLAMRLVKEFTTRELIDALSYDFDPLQGMSAPSTGAATPNLRDVQGQRTQARGARVSTIEIAIRAQAKRFLAHPLVVQHLEAIWAGTVVFHSEADNLHRKPMRLLEEQRRRNFDGYGTVNQHSPTALPADAVLSRKARATKTIKRPVDMPLGRRSVTLYDPREASLFKLSRLRVPRYRQVFSTLSLATMLGLFLAVLIERSLYITPLEVVFWFWSAGYMLDEVVGFSEQGFGLYILSVWNAFDLGILLLFVVYYCLRLYGILLVDVGKHHIASMAYDVLASTAVLLFPRLFSVLDHYRYFSQLLIAFRMMAQDMAAILILIMIACSGFFVAFTLSFSDDATDGNAVAYALFQMLMGFTPAAWEKWAGYNMLGKAIMGMFLIICHFLIVTILITVLTNSFMAIVQNANEEHQFLFAINTISMVKSDALFSYIPPTNVFGWVLSPLRYVMPFRQYVRFNRTVIKVTHFPILFVIFAYERVILSGMAYEPTDLIEKPAVSQSKLAFTLNKAQEVFSPGHRLREPSVVNYHKDRALDEVFRKPFRGSTLRTTTREMDPERRNSTNVVDKWMQAAENEGGASPPMEQPRSVLERLEHGRPKFRRAMTTDRMRNPKLSRDFSGVTRSLASDPDAVSIARRPQRIEEESEIVDMSTETLPLETDAEADDEHVESDHATPALGESAISVVDKQNQTADDDSDEEYFQTPTAGKSPLMQLSTAAKARLQGSPDLLQADAASYQARPHPQRRAHNRNASSGTVMFAPQADDSSASHPLRASRPATVRNSGGTATPTAGQQLHSGQRTPKPKQAQQPAKARPTMPSRLKTAPGGFVGMSFMDITRRTDRQPSFNARALDLASEIGDNKWGPSGGDVGGISGMPASFSEQFQRERDLERRREEERRRGEEEEKGMVNRIMLARMHTLEEGFREVLKEIKDLNANSSRRTSEVDLAGHRARHERPRIETASSSQSHVNVPPKTPVGRIGGIEAKPRRSPKKLQRRGTKGKEVDRPGSSMRTENEVPSPLSVIERPSEEGAEEGATAERPGTAIRTLQPSEKDEREM